MQQDFTLGSVIFTCSRNLPVQTNCNLCQTSLFPRNNLATYLYKRIATSYACFLGKKSRTRNLPVQTNCNQEDCVIYCADKARNLPVQTNCNYPEIPANLFMSLATYLYKRIATFTETHGFAPMIEARNLPVQTNCNCKIVK